MLLEGTNLTKKFGGFVAVNQVNISVDRGEILSIIGPNGAGKTTLFNLLTGTYDVSSGTIKLDGDDITDAPEYERPYLGISRSYQITNIYESLSVFENIQTAVAVFHSNYYDVIRPIENNNAITEQTNSLLSAIGLLGNSSIQANSLPHGHRRRLEIGMSLASDPKLLLLDEPTAGLGGEESEQIVRLIKELKGDKGVILVEHDVEQVLRVSDKVAVLERGNVITTGTPEEVQSDERVIEAYLGESTNA